MSTASLYRADHVGSFLRPADLLAARTTALAKELLNDLEKTSIFSAYSTCRKSSG